MGSAPVPAPFFMVNKSLGGDDMNSGTCQKGVTEGRGLNNIGLLVSTCGSVTHVDSRTFLIDDGGQTPIKCLATAGMVINPGLDYARVTAISSCEISGASVDRTLLLRGPDDLRPF